MFCLLIWCTSQNVHRGIRAGLRSQEVWVSLLALLLTHFVTLEKLLKHHESFLLKVLNNNNNNNNNNCDNTFLIFKIYLFIYLFIYLWLCWVFISVPGLSLVAASGGHSSSRCAGLSLSRPLLLQSTGSRRAGSVVVALGPSCSAACGIFPDQGSNPCPLH